MNFTLVNTKWYSKGLILEKEETIRDEFTRKAVRAAIEPPSE